MKRFLNMWATLLSAMVLAWSASFFAPAAKADRISVAYCIDCVPFQFKDEDGQPAGLIIDLWRLWSEKTGSEIDFRGASWDETLNMVRDGKADAHAGLFFNDERNTFLEYGAALVETDTHFFTHKDLPAIDTVEGLAGHKVGVISGDFVEGYLKERLAPENIVGFESYEALMGALGDGELKVFAADTPTGIHHLKKSGLGETFIFPARKPLYQNNWLVAAGKGNTELISMIDGGMGLIEARERREIAQRWGAGGYRKSAGPGPWESFSDSLTNEELLWLAEHKTFRLGVDPAYPPFDFIAEDGTYSGMGADYARLMGERLG
ncbi:MAG: transporter substrate-binding domain-containing protein, partial [Proteobacteria bacterium]|nr:transporter substrate-binding domain-containing protein [Pseudomonadota bacterium]